MRTDAYIDTNIYVYVALRNRAYFEKCRLILRDALSGRLTAYGSPMVVAELLGSLSRVDPVLAREALRAYLAMPLRSLELTQEALLLASLISTVVNVGYDSIHASLILLYGVSSVITNDLDDWLKLKRNLNRITEEARRNGFYVKAEELEVVTPDTYPAR